MPIRLTPQTVPRQQASWQRAGCAVAARALRYLEDDCRQPEPADCDRIPPTNMTPRVSVVMPVYNGERFLREAIQSILGQTLKDFELIVIDDASEDSTPQLLEALTSSDKRIRVHRLDRNSGAIAARNVGMSLAAADLIAPMDADDVALPHRLAVQSEFLGNHPDVDVVGGYVQIIDERGRDRSVKVQPTSPGLTAWSFLFVNPMFHSTVMMRRRIPEILRGYSAAYPGSEDFEFFSRASRHGRITNLPNVLVKYRIWEGNMTTRQWDAQERSASRIVSESVEHYSGTSCDFQTAYALRGLAIDRYPSDKAEFERLADWLPKLFEGFLTKSPVPSSGHREIRTDAATKLWLLAALAAKRYPAWAAKTGAAATRMQPTSVISFVRKAADRAAQKRRLRALSHQAP
jgi:glycosyltransferase involved in cell wall biosynthesis